MSKSHTKEYKRLEEEEKNLIFKRFTRADTLELGLAILETGKKFSLPITTEITVNGLVIFRHFTDGSMADSEFWMNRKRNSVNLMSMSTLRFKHWLGMLELTLQDRKLPINEYTSDGGGYPIILEGAGLIGSICVSGLTNDEEDHACIVEAIKKILK